MLPSKGFRMRASLIKGFSNVTVNVENLIKAKNLTPEDRTIVNDGKGTWSRQELWVAAKIISQFNFFTSFELALMLLLSITNDRVGRIHKLNRLYDALPEDVRGELETLFSSHVLDIGLVVGRAFTTGNDPELRECNTYTRPPRFLRVLR